MKHLLRNHIFWVLLLSICGIIMLLPIFRPGLLVTDDGDWMVIRLSSFYQSFRDGQFPVRFLTRLNYSYGYPVANFLYPGFLYAGSFLHVAGLSFTSSIEAIIVISVLAGAVGIFYWLRLYFSKISSFFGAISFLVSPYLLYDIYIRGSVGEIVAIGVWGWLLYAIESKKIWLFIPLFSLLLVSHNTLSLFYVCILVVLIAIKGYRNFIVPSILSFGLASFFWIPAILEKRFVIFDTIAVSDPSHYFASTSNLLFMSLPFITSAILYFIFRSKKYYETGTVFLYVFALTFFLCLSISGFLWDGYLLKTFVQFPYRLLAVWLFIGPWFLGYVGDLKKTTIWKVIPMLFICIMAFFAIPYAKSQSIDRPQGFYSTNEGTTTVLNEYMPRWVKIFPSKRTSDRMEVFSGNAGIQILNSSSKMYEASIATQEDSVIQVNTLYYPGWGALLDEKPVAISYDNDFGLMRIRVPKGQHHLYMAFRETKSRFAADLLSLISFICYFGIFLVPHFYHKYIHTKNIL